MINRLAVHEFQGHICNLRPSKWVAFHISLEPSVNHGLETSAGAVKGHNLEIARLDTGCLQSFDCAMPISSFWISMPWKSTPGLYFCRKACITGRASARVKLPVWESRILMLAFSLSLKPWLRPTLHQNQWCQTVQERRHHWAAACSFPQQRGCLPIPYRNQYEIHTGIYRN